MPPLNDSDSSQKFDTPVVISKRFLVVACILFAGVCTSRAAQLAWLADDSFISFRYARNLVDGLGLVYNAGEYVEGYTNLLWTLLMAASMAAGATPEVASQVLGIGCLLALAGALFTWSRHRVSHAGLGFLPLAAALVLVVEDFQVWATGGLETSLFALLSTSGLLLVAAGQRPRRHLVAAAVLLGLATMTRPDGAIFAAIAVFAAWSNREGTTRSDRLVDFGCIAVPLLLIGTALVAFKLSYYGDLFPTAFYSKSALDPYYDQGLFYVYLFFKRNWAVLALAALAAWSITRKGMKVTDRSRVIFGSAFIGFTLYVIHSGGDFMYARRLIPALPFLFLVVEDVLVSDPRRRIAIAVFFAGLLGAALPLKIYPDYADRINGIANEREFYPEDYVETWRQRGAIASASLRGAPLNAMFQGGMCVFGYYSALPYLAEMTGLTQYSLAKQPLAERGLVGHEKSADEAWLTGHEIHMIFLRKTPPLLADGRRRVDLIRFGRDLSAKIWIYSDSVMDRLRDDRNVDFVAIEDVLAQAEREIAETSYADAREILDFLERYYFRTAGSQRQAVAKRLRALVASRRE